MFQYLTTHASQSHAIRSKASNKQQIQLDPCIPTENPQDLTFLAFITCSLWDIHWGFFSCPSIETKSVGTPSFISVYSISEILEYSRHFDPLLLLQGLQSFISVADLIFESFISSASSYPLHSFYHILIFWLLIIV